MDLHSSGVHSGSQFKMKKNQHQEGRLTPSSLHKLVQEPSTRPTGLDILAGGLATHFWDVAQGLLWPPR